jgi:hypothetical protein
MRRIARLLGPLSVAIALVACILAAPIWNTPALAQNGLSGRMVATDSNGKGQPVSLTCLATAGCRAAVNTIPYGPTDFTCTVTVSTATTIQAVGGSCVAPGAGLSLYLTDIRFDASATGIGADAFPTLKSGTGGTCGSNTAVVWGWLSAAATNATDNRSRAIKLAANNELCWISSTAGSKFVQVSGFIAP